MKNGKRTNTSGLNSMLLKTPQVNEKRRNEKLTWDKWKWKHNLPKSMGGSKSSSKRKIIIIIVTTQASVKKQTKN